MTEPKRHPHADVLIAIAEGREVQARLGEDRVWVDAHNLDYGTNPISDPEYPWRVKPQKLKRWVNVYPNDDISAYETREEADRAADHRRIACVEIEFEEGDGLI